MGDKNFASSTKKSSSLTNANADDDNHIREHARVGIAHATGFHVNMLDNNHGNNDKDDSNDNEMRMMTTM